MHHEDAKTLNTNPAAVCYRPADPVATLRAIRTRIEAEDPETLSECERECFYLCDAAITAAQPPASPTRNTVPYTDIVAHDHLVIHYLQDGHVWATYNQPDGVYTHLLSEGSGRAVLARAVHAKDLLPRTSLLAAAGAAFLGTFG